MKEEILNLRTQGKTYKEIKEELGCSLSTISFHCAEGQKEKSNARSRKLRKDSYNSLYKKIRYFQKRDSKNKYYDKSKPLTFTLEEFKEKFPKNTKCYLSGIDINLDNKDWELDHIIPISRGGSNSLDNLGILHKEVNQMKGRLLNEELIEWCQKILKLNKNCAVEKG